MSSPKKIFFFVLLIFFQFFTACTRSEDAKKPVSNAEVTPTAVHGEVNLAIWGNYLSNETKERFSRETGLKLNITNYSSNEELLAKVQTGASGLDVAVPSDYMVDVMIRLGLLEKMQREKIPNSAKVSKDYLNQSFDPENQFSLPYGVSITGIAVNRDLYKGPVKSWKDLLENPELAGKFALLDDVREVAGAALKMNGHSLNSVDPAEIKQAQEQLLKVRKSVKMFTSDTIDILKNKEVAVAQAFSMDALQAAAATNGKIEFVIPSEGSTWALDNLVVLKGSKNIEAAQVLMNFLLNPDNNLEFVRNIRSGPVVEGVREKLPADLKDSPILFPSKPVMAKLEHMKDLAEKNRLYEDLWTKVKTAR